MIYAVVFSAGLIIGMSVAAWWFGDTFVRLIAYFVLCYGFPLVTKEELAEMFKIPIPKFLR